MRLTVPNGVRIDRITAERRIEEECGSFSNRSAGQVFTCWEQGGGIYIVRVYSGGQPLYAEEVDVEADECHVKQRASIEIDLTAM
jgi:hypothetical protein